jgi:hypothetical protein
MPQYTLEQVYRMLMSGTFEMWHDTTFVDHVMGEEGAQSKEQILEELDILLQ